MLNNLFDRTSREEKIFHLLDRDGCGLEIGPSIRPLAPKKKGFKVQSIDHLTAKELKEKYRDHGINLDEIEEVDFVWSGQPLPELVGKTKCYDWIIASHVIEHVPNLISFLQECERLLTNKGILSLAVPDKRYCFDYFSPISSTGAILDAHGEKRTKPSQGQIFEHYANACSRRGAISWSTGLRGPPDKLIHPFDEARANWQRASSSPDYIDVHCWRFTPLSFQVLIADLSKLGLVNLEIKHAFPRTGSEFYVSLGHKTVNRAEPDRLRALKARKNESR